MWPSYNRPASWDRYYSQSLGRDQSQVAITSGIAAALTVGVFFAIFLLTFGCRLLNSRRRERAMAVQRRAANLAAARLSLDDQQRMFVCCPAVTPPPLPGYEAALTMPSLEKGQLPSPPPFDAAFQLPAKKHHQQQQQQEEHGEEETSRSRPQ